MEQTLVERITQKRMKMGRTKLVSIQETAKQIGIGASSLYSVIKYGEAAAGDNIRPLIEKWLKKD